MYAIFYSRTNEVVLCIWINIRPHYSIETYLLNIVFSIDTSFHLVEAK